MIDFIRENYLIFVVVFTAVFEVSASLVVIFKTPKNKRLKALNFCYEKIPTFIIEAESLLTNGVDKKVFVLKKCFSYLSKLLRCSESRIENLFSSEICAAIEHILDTPQKKGK